MLGALVLIFLPAVQQSGIASQSASPSPAVGDTAAVPSGALSGAAMAKTELLEMDKPAVADSAAQPSASAGVAPAAPALAPQLSTVAPLPMPVAVSVAMAVPATPAAVTVPSAAAGIIGFKAKGASWVEVTDAKGTVVLRRTLAAGEEAGASGVLPLAAVVGRVDATQVEVRGKAFDLVSVSKDNVARFEVK